MKTALASSAAAIDALVAAPTAANAAAAADEVSRAEVVINGHLDHEERDVEAPMGDLEDDPECKALAKKLRPASIVDAANALAWMQDGAGERERSALRSNIPGPVVTRADAGASPGATGARSRRSGADLRRPRPAP